MKSKLKKHEKICKNHVFCHLKMPDVYNNILESKPEKNHSNTHLLFMQIENVYY